MRIEVVMSEWEQACCGQAFRVGEIATWTLLAVDPATTTGGSARFHTDQHDLTSEAVPHWEVTGTVRAITGITYPLRPVTGERRSYVWDTERPHLRTLDAVEARMSSDISEYLIDLEVAAECALPAFAPDPSIVEYRADLARDAECGRERMTDAIGVMLESAADDAEATHGTVADIVRETERSAITIIPHREGAAAVRWARSVREADGIDIHTGEGSWRLPATIENARLATVFVDAAAHGRVDEDVVHLEGHNRRLDTRVTGDDGHTWIASVTIEPVVQGESMVVFGDWERLQRGSVTHLPWSAPNS